MSRQVFTRIIGPYGCLAVLPENLPIGQQVTVVNTVTSESNSGIVVWNSNQQAEGWEIGIELTQPSMDFWGLEL